jgi:hypothetical protein
VANGWSWFSRLADQKEFVLPFQCQDFEHLQQAYALPPRVEDDLSLHELTPDGSSD